VGSRVVVGGGHRGGGGLPPGVWPSV